MKQSFLLLLLLLLISSSKLSATSLATKHGQADHQETSLKEISIDHDELMGLEDCTGKEEDEECLKRRMTAEAHLDYIYTQHHKP